MSDVQLHYIEVEAKADCRLDICLAEQLSEFSRSRLQAMIKDGSVLVDGERVKPSYPLTGTETIRVAVCEDLDEPEILAENIPLDIVYEDHDIIIVNKPQGMVVHPAAGYHSGTLVNALLYHCQDLSGINGVKRPGIVHRIDKDTSGLLVVAKHDAAHLGLAEQWKVHDIKRVYHAVVWGLVNEDSGTIDAPIGRHPHDRIKMAVEPKNGKPAITHYRVLERFPQANCTYLELRLETGRTHQIRVHMAYLGHPVVGDPVYAPRRKSLGLPGQVLHAKVIGFNHPIHGEYLEFESELPEEFMAVMQNMRTVRE